MPLGQLAGLAPAEQLRSVFGQALLEVSREEPRVVVLDGDHEGALVVRDAHAVRPARGAEFSNDAEVLGELPEERGRFRKGHVRLGAERRRLHRRVQLEVVEHHEGLRLICGRDDE
ncbi:MAG: hypothetical protein K6V36_16070, partial [Anaerolineae bacterium]|nr:hypothetical protein [Anaerolineae bacterium]